MIFALMNRNLFFSILRFELMVQTRTKSFWLISLIPPIAMILMFVVNYNTGHIDSVLVDNRTSFVQPIESTGTMNIQYGTSAEWEKEGFDAYVCIIQTDEGGILCKISSLNVLHPADQAAIKDNLETKMAEARIGVNLSDIKAQESSKVRIEMRIENPRYKLMGVSMAAVFLLYLIVLQFASSILRMTGREKMNKICEILLSAVPVRTIMAGKLVACLLAAFLQIMVWCLIGMAVMFLSDKIPMIHVNRHAMDSLMQIFTLLPKGQFFEFAFVYMLYLVGGFLLYCTMFSILGAISNENTNTQQFSLVVTMPLLITFVYVVKDFGGDSLLLTWLSYIPVSSPIASIPVVAKQGTTLQVVVSLLILYATTFVTFYYACVLYAKGALVSKNKVTLKTIIKWVAKSDSSK